jgi:hypothetical protein
MSALLLLAGLLLSGGDVRFDESTLEFEGRLLDHRFVDPDGDGVSSLCVALLRPDGTRELRLHALEPRRIAPRPSHTVPVLEDVLAYGFADVREEPGEELLFLTRTGAYSYSLTREGYRGNIARLATLDLIYSVPDRRELPFWAYTVPGGAGERDLVLLPGRGGLVALGPSRDGESGDPYEVRTGFRADGREVDTGDERGEVSLSGRGGVRLSFRGGSDGDGPFLDEGDQAGSLLRGGESYRAPALVDLDGDGLRDLLLQVEDELRVYLCGADGLPSAPTRVEVLPPELEEAALTLVELNGDGRLDLLARVSEEGSALENSEQRLFLHLAGPGRLLQEAPAQVLRFEAATLRASVADLHGDGRPDLLLRKFTMPSVIESVSGLEFELAHLAFFGTGERVPFERKPALNQVEVFGAESVGDAIKRRRLERDCDGDGLPDLVEVDTRGRIAVRRVLRDSGFFSGETWELEESAWKRFETRGSILSLEVHDLDGDGLADLVSPGPRSITLLLSERGR